MAKMSPANWVPAAILCSPLHRLRGRQVQASAEASRDPDVVAEALTALVLDHPPYGRWAHIHTGPDRTPDPADVRAEVARGRVLIRVQLPPGDGTTR